MAGDLVLIVLKVKLIVIGQLEREEGRIDASPPEGVGGRQRSDLTAVALELGSRELKRSGSCFVTHTEHFLSPPLLWGFAGWR